MLSCLSAVRAFDCNRYQNARGQHAVSLRRVWYRYHLKVVIPDTYLVSVSVLILLILLILASLLHPFFSHHRLVNKAAILSHFAEPVERRAGDPCLSAAYLLPVGCR